MNLIWVTEAKYVSGYKIKLIFNNGIKAVVDLKDNIRGKIFQPLKDIEYFKRFKQNKWTIEWDCEVNFAPKYLYKLVTGK